MLMEGGQGADAASTEREPKSTGTHRVSCAPANSQGQGISCLALAQTDTETAVLLCLILASGRQGPALPQKAPL